MLQRAVHTEMNSECSHFGTGFLLWRGLSTARDTVDLADLLPEIYVSFKDLSFFFSSFASILMECLLHLSYDNPLNPMQIPSATVCVVPPCLALCHGPFIPHFRYPHKSHLLCSQPSEYAPWKLPGKGLPLICAFLSLLPKIHFNVPF